MNQLCKRMTALFALVCLIAFGAGVVIAQEAAVPPVPPPSFQTPVLTSLHPAIAKAGSAPVQVLVTGQGFLPGNSTVLVNGSPHATVVFNFEVLAFQLSKQDLAQPGILLINVVNHNQLRATISNTLPFAVLK